MKSYRVMLSYALLGFGLAGCAAAPTQEMADARALLRAAEEAGARELASSSLGNARKALSSAETQLEIGYFRDARTNAVHAQQEATRARNIALAIVEAKAAVARAANGKVLAGAEEALRKAEEAALANDEQGVFAEAAKAVRLATEGEK